METTTRNGGDLNELRACYQELLTATSREELLEFITALLEHGMFQTRMFTASGVAMKGWAHRPDLREEVLQEATFRIIRQLQDGPPLCEDCGADGFGGWIWRICHRACCRAWAKTRPLWLRSVELVDEEILEQFAEPHDVVDVQELLIECLSQVRNDTLRKILVDWSCGMTAAESANECHLSRKAVGHLRRRGLQIAQEVHADNSENDFRHGDSPQESA